MFYSFACLGVRLLLRLFTRCRVEGLENVPPSGPLLLVANHLNLVDPPVLGALLPRRIVFVAKEELFRMPLVGWIVKWYGAFGIKRGQADLQALRTAVSVLRSGGVLGMFPEGHRSRTGKMQEAYAGAALVALMGEAPVLPVGIDGTDRLRSPLSLLTRPAITVRVGPPFTLDAYRGRRGGIEEATRHMMARVASLLPEERRGFYAEAAEEILRQRGL